MNLTPDELHTLRALVNGRIGFINSLFFGAADFKPELEQLRLLQSRLDSGLDDETEDAQVGPP
jgi:hypothetical protein